MGNVAAWDLIAMIGVSGLIALGLYIWYLAALSRLFPKLDLPSSHGWIPVWNDWRLLQRADLPGWLVLAFLVPGLAIVGYIVRLIAYHRLTTEARGSVGYTVAGAFIPALWATLLNGHMARSGGGVMRQSSGLPDFAPAGPQSGGFAPQAGGFAPQPTQQPTGFAPQPAHQQFGAPQAPAQPVTPQFAPQPAPQQSFAPPQPPVAAQPAPAAQEPWSPPAPQSVPQSAPAPSGFDALLAEAQQPAAPEAAPVPRHAAPEAAPQLDGPLGSDTEREYARLAAEGLQAPPASRLEPQAPPQPFSWPGSAPAASEPAPAEPRVESPAAPPVPPTAPPVPPAASPVPPVPAAAPAPVPPTVSAPPIPVPVPVAPAADPALDPAVVHTDSEAAYTTRKVRKAEPTTEAAGAEPQAMPAEVERTDDELDRTVVVARRPRIDWVLELPDGERLPLRDEEIIIGRKPRGPEGMALLTIPDPTRTLSKSHARLRYDGDMWSIEDLGSTNGLVLLFDDDTEEDVTPHSEVLATERMVIGTLEVRLIRNGDA